MRLPPRCQRGTRAAKHHQLCRLRRLSRTTYPFPISPFRLRPRRLRRPNLFPALFVFVAACNAAAPRPTPEPVPRTADGLASEYVDLAFALQEHDPLFLDLVFTDVRPEDATMRLPEIAERAERLVSGAREMARTGDEFRVRRIEVSLRALAFRARFLLGERRPVAVELREVFGLEWIEPEVDLERLHFRVDRALSTVGPLKVRVRRHYERHDVSPEFAESRLREAFAACRELGLPGAVDLDVEPLGLYWMTRAEALGLPTGPAPFYRYRGSGVGVLQLPRGLPLRSAELHRLACHEGVPGHHLQAVVADLQYRATGWPELGIVPLYGPRTAVFEGLAVTVERFARGSTADDALRALEPAVSRTLAGYLDGELSRLEAVRALDFEALVPDPHGLLEHADRFGGYALVRPSADPVFHAALENVLRSEDSPEERFGRILRAIREAMSPGELARAFSSPLHN